MAAPRPPGFDTLSLHAGHHPDAVNGARAVPIYQTTSYVFDDTDHAASLFNLERPGYVYSRISNPTVAVLEERLAGLEGGVGAICTSSGMAAMHIGIATLLGTGDHIVASASLYGGTVNLLAHTLPRFGITTTFVKPRDLEGFRAALKPNTRLVIGETIGNPGLEVFEYSGDRRHRSSGRRPAAHRQHLRHALSVPAARIRRRSGDALAHEVDRRPRHRDRRRLDRRRPLRLAGVRQVPDFDGAGRGISGHHLHRAIRSCSLRDARAHRRTATIRGVPRLP